MCEGSRSVNDRAGLLDFLPGRTTGGLTIWRCEGNNEAA